MPEQRISARVAAIAESATLAVDARAKALKAAGEDVIGFGAGEPDFPTPAHIVEAAAAAARDPKNHVYTPAAGLPELKEAIASKTLRDSGYAVEPSQVLVTNGGKHAVYNAFQTLLDPDRMRNQRTSILKWPYVEGLRLDEAMHPLAILSTGLYGRDLLPQNGAPLRLVAPWKYGFKSIKSIVRITVVDRQPPTTWNLAAADEYGFYSNVNPDVPHPRWSQATERRIGETSRRPTLLFNGYADQVASLYMGLDLRANF